MSPGLHVMLAYLTALGAGVLVGIIVLAVSLVKDLLRSSLSGSDINDDEV